MVDIEDVSIELVDPNDSFGPVQSAFMRLAGPLVSSRSLLRVKDQETQSRSKEGWGILETSHLGDDIRFIPDESNPRVYNESGLGIQGWLSALEESDVYLLAIGEIDWISSRREAMKFATFGLVLRREEQERYSRVGLWMARKDMVECHAGTTGQFQVETITMV